MPDGFRTDIDVEMKCVTMNNVASVNLELQDEDLENKVSLPM